MLRSRRGSTLSRCDLWLRQAQPAPLAELVEAMWRGGVGFDKLSQRQCIPLAKLVEAIAPNVQNKPMICLYNHVVTLPTPLYLRRTLWRIKLV